MKRSALEPEATGAPNEQKSKKAKGHFEKVSQIKTSEEMNQGGKGGGDEKGYVGNQIIPEGGMQITEEQRRIIEVNRQIALHRRARKSAEQEFAIEPQIIAAKQSDKDGSEAKQTIPKELGGHEAVDKGGNKKSVGVDFENESSKIKNPDKRKRKIRKR